MEDFHFINGEVLEFYVLNLNFAIGTSFYTTKKIYFRILFAL